MKTILVTGGAGFIGSNFVRYVLDNFKDYRVIVLDALTYAGHVQNLPPEIMSNDYHQFWYGDVKNGQLVDSLVAESNVVVHFAAETHVTRSIYDNRTFVDTDVVGTQTISNSIAKYRDRIERFIHISTSEVYGTAVGNVMNEDHPLNPMSPYASAKCAADRLVYSYWMTYQIPAIIVRPFNNYGPYQHLEKVVPRFITSCILGEPMKVHGAGEAMRDFMHVRDHCEALGKILSLPIEKVVGQTLNLGTGRHTSIGELAYLIREIMDTPEIQIDKIGDRPGQVVRHTCDASKARDLIGWEPRISLEEGLKEAALWYAQNEAWWRPQLWLRTVPITTSTGKREFH